MHDGVGDARQACHYTTRRTALLQYMTNCTTRCTVPSSTRPTARRAARSLQYTTNCTTAALSNCTTRPLTTCRIAQSAHK